MSEKATLARPYARALFEVTKADGGYLSVENQLYMLKELQKSSEYVSLVKSVSIGVDEKAEKIIAAFSDVVSDHVKNFIRVLSQRNRFLLFPEIYQEFKKLRHDHEGAVSVEVTSAFELSDSDKKYLVSALGGFFAKKAQPEYIQDASLIGGVLVRAEDKVIDYSIKGKLKELENTLMVEL